MIRLDGVSVVYGRGPERVHALKEATAEFTAGQIACIVGPSGSGKSTLLALLSGLRLPTTGTVWFDGLRLEQLNEPERAALRRRDVGLIFQGFRLLRHLSVLENLRVAAEILDVPRGEQLERASTALRRVGLSDKGGRSLWELSGGEKQRVAIARAALCRPRLVLADEPTASLDWSNGHNCLELLEELASEAAVIVVTHDPRVADLAPVLWNLDDGVLTRRR